MASLPYASLMPKGILYVSEAPPRPSEVVALAARVEKLRGTRLSRGEQVSE